MSDAQVIRLRGKQDRFVKVSRGAERFWSVILAETDDALTVRCDNQTEDPKAPRYGEVFTVTPDEILDRCERSAQ